MEQRFDLNSHRYYVESFEDGHQELVIKDHEQSSEEWVEHMYNVYKNDTNSQYVTYHIMGNWTYVYDAHGHFGKARKSDKDKFCRNTGIAIAYARMKGMPVHKDFMGEKCEKKDNGWKKERAGYNGWIMCLDNTKNPDDYTPGKLYKFHDGILTADDGFEMKRIYSFDEWEKFSHSKWKEMTDGDVRAYVPNVKFGACVSETYTLIPFGDLIDGVGLCEETWNFMRDNGVEVVDEKYNEYTGSYLLQVVSGKYKYWVPGYAVVKE